MLNDLRNDLPPSGNDGTVPRPVDFLRDRTPDRAYDARLACGPRTAREA